MLKVIPRIGIGPMSKNIVDSAIEYANIKKSKIILIPSRRQVEYSGGYVNNWTTSSFSDYVKGKSNNILLERDHGGPGQGLNMDDGLVSLRDDANALDIIHIDPWKEYRNIEEGSYKTSELIKYCIEINNKLMFEVGTEQAIRQMTATDIDKMLGIIKDTLGNDFCKVVYAVVQSGTGISNGENIGKYNSERLIDMLNVVKKYGKLSKEHNGDFIPTKSITDRFKLGLDTINIAPEFGQMETNSYIKLLNNSEFEYFFKICLESEKWKKWVSNDFQPYDRKNELVQITGHYLISDEKFSDIKSKYPIVSSMVRDALFLRLDEIICQAK
jgi:fructose/tagatose bisphosphate aldolase